MVGPGIEPETFGMTGERFHSYTTCFRQIKLSSVKTERLVRKGSIESSPRFAVTTSNLLARKRLTKLSVIILLQRELNT